MAYKSDAERNTHPLGRFLMHTEAVRAIFLDASNGKLQDALEAVQACHQYIGLGVPCARHNARRFAGVALLMNTWPAELAEPISQLLRAYVRAGYVRTNDREDAFGAADYSTVFEPRRTPLEIAIRQGHFDAAVVLVDEGDRLDWYPIGTSQLGVNCPDLMALAKGFWRDRPESLARLSEAQMRRRIRESAAADCSSRSVAPPRRRAAL